MIAPILIVVILIVFFAINSKSIEENTVEDVPELSVREIANELEEKKIAAADSVSKNTAKVGPVKSGEVTVDISTRELTWMRLVKDYSDTSEYLLKPGNNLSAMAESTLVFLIGNAGGVLFKVNGIDVGTLGSSSEIVTNLKITSKGIVSKRLKMMPKEGTADSLTNN